MTYFDTNHSAEQEGAASVDAVPIVLIAALRDLLSESYGEQISALAPLACDGLHAQYRAATDAADKAILRAAIHKLANYAQPLRSEIQRELGKRFDTKMNAPDDALSHTGRFSLEALQLLEHLGMQEEFELERAVERLRAAAQFELNTLSDGIARLLGRNALAESHNPVFPRVFARTLLDSLAAIGCEPQVKHAAFRALCPLLEEVLPYIYEQASSLLDLGGRTLSAEFKVPRAHATYGGV